MTTIDKPLIRPEIKITSPNLRLEAEKKNMNRALQAYRQEIAKIVLDFSHSLLDVIVEIIVDYLLCSKEQMKIPDLPDCCQECARARERSFIEELDNMSFRTPFSKSQFFIISSEWLNRWRDYVKDETNKTPRPGPITNCHLLDRTQAYNKIKTNLKLKVDYRGLDGPVWFILQELYGGGPVINRPTLNIYSPAILA